MAKQNLNVNGDMILSCHECANSQAGTMIPTGGFILVCSITERPAVARCEKWEYEQFAGSNASVTGAELAKRPR